MPVNSRYRVDGSTVELQQHRNHRGALHLIVPVEVFDSLASGAGWERLPDRQDASPVVVPVEEIVADDAFVVMGGDPAAIGEREENYRAHLRAEPVRGVFDRAPHASAFKGEPPADPFLVAGAEPPRPDVPEATGHFPEDDQPQRPRRARKLKPAAQATDAGPAVSSGTADRSGPLLP